MNKRKNGFGSAYNHRISQEDDHQEPSLDPPGVGGRRPGRKILRKHLSSPEHRLMHFEHWQGSHKVLRANASI